MSPTEAFDYVQREKPPIIHLSGKTSTGKSTFAARLKKEFGYDVVTLDEILGRSVADKLPDVDRGLIFFEVYKQRNKPEWINMFVTAAHKVIQEHLDSGRPLIIDGAVAHPTTAQEVLSIVPDVPVLFFSPQNLQTYQQYLTSRFVQATADYNPGLPRDFWALVDEDAFRQFCQDRVVSPPLTKALADYAKESQASSRKRLQGLQKVFPKLQVVNI